MSASIAALGACICIAAAGIEDAKQRTCGNALIAAIVMLWAIAQATSATPGPLATTTALFAATAGTSLALRNTGTGPILLGALGAALWAGAAGTAHVTADAALGAAVLALGYAAWRCGAIGAGDAKLVAAITLWTGSTDIAAFAVGAGTGSATLGLLGALAGPHTTLRRRGAPLACVIGAAGIATIGARRALEILA